MHHTSCYYCHANFLRVLSVLLYSFKFTLLSNVLYHLLCFLLYLFHLEFILLSNLNLIVHALLTCDKFQLIQPLLSMNYSRRLFHHFFFFILPRLFMLLLAGSSQCIRFSYTILFFYFPIFSLMLFPRISCLFVSFIFLSYKENDWQQSLLLPGFSLYTLSSTQL